MEIYFIVYFFYFSYSNWGLTEIELYSYVFKVYCYMIYLIFVMMKYDAFQSINYWINLDW